MTTRKRTLSNTTLDSDTSKSNKNKKTQSQKRKSDEELIFEDPFEDEYDEEDVALSQKIDGIELENDSDIDYEEMNGYFVKRELFEQQHESVSDEDDLSNTDRESSEVPHKKSDIKNKKGNKKKKKKKKKNEVKIWRPGIDKLKSGEKLDYDSSAYEMIHFLRMEWPCLSFDVLLDKGGFQREKYPLTAYVVTGTQAEKQHENKILVLKMSELHKTKHDDSDSENESDTDDDDADDDPVLEFQQIPCAACTNRIRSMPQTPHIVASWFDSGVVAIWDISRQLKILESPGSVGPKRETTKPIFMFQGHSTEGFAVDWNHLEQGKGRLVTGDCQAKIYLWQPQNSGWHVDNVPYTGHKKSIEDLQWSPVEVDVFASCSVDKSIRLWDVRKKHGSALTQPNAHESDVNVISWNEKVTFALLSGGDDGSFKVWDLRKFDEPIHSCKYHQKPIISVEWDPNDFWSFAVASEDDSISIWDISLVPNTSKDNDNSNEESDECEDDVEIPDYLLFVHQGQQHIKEVHWHRQLPVTLLSTAMDGLNIFRPAIIDKSKQKN
jgi:ribosome assembly protein RRB1